METAAIGGRFPSDRGFYCFDGAYIPILTMFPVFQASVVA